MNNRSHNEGVGEMVKAALWRWGTSSPVRLFFSLRIAWRMWRAERRRIGTQRRLGGPVPHVLAISPTMRCNYDCAGCYSRGRRTDDELSTAELDALFTEAETLGVLAAVVTGGEPFLRGDLLDLMACHRRLLFIPVTNGRPMTAQTARRIARSTNVVPLVSIEGFRQDTDERRRPGAHQAALRALRLLGEARACFGFAAMAAAANVEHLSDDAFVDQMIALGCSVGYFTEYVPCGPDPRPEWTLDEAARAAFRQRVLGLRGRKPIVLIQFPNDEYGPDGRCSAAGQSSLHVNSQGDVEPCPFMPLARENVRQGGLVAAFRSPFLRAIREHPSLLRRQRLACSLFEHRAELGALASQYGAQPSG